MKNNRSDSGGADGVGEGGREAEKRESSKGIHILGNICDNSLIKMEMQILFFVRSSTSRFE